MIFQNLCRSFTLKKIEKRGNELICIHAVSKEVKLGSLISPTPNCSNLWHLLSPCRCCRLVKEEQSTIERFEVAVGEVF